MLIQTLHFISSRIISPRMELFMEESFNANFVVYLKWMAIIFSTREAIMEATFLIIENLTVKPCVT